MNLHEALKHLIRSFEDAGGLPQGSYIATRCLINSLWGIRAERVFEKYVDVAAGRYYLLPGRAEACLRDMLEQISP